MKITQQADGNYKTGSSGKIYTVNLEEMTCSCPDYTYRMSKVFGLCKHLQAAKDFAEGRDEETYSQIIHYVNDSKEVEKGIIVKKFNPEAVDDLLSRGVL